ncbi:MAG: hypothetical protein JO214_15320, partial [Frankiaceae bacterium]|nr:hypothetical protein [Frankiaceae bacterium]
AGGGPGTSRFNVDQHLEGLADMAALGVTWNSVGVPGTSLDLALESLEQYGAEIIGKGDPDGCQESASPS